MVNDAVRLVATWVALAGVVLVEAAVLGLLGLGYLAWRAVRRG